jgi:hypothetical protein
VGDETTGATVGEVIGRLIELELVTAEEVAEELTPDKLAKPLVPPFGATASHAALSLLGRLRMMYHLDHSAFSDACENGLDEYRREPESIARCSRGLLTISDVTLVEGDDRHLLRFQCNGAPEEWPIPHDEEEAYEAQLVFSTYMRSLVADGSPERWCLPEQRLDWHNGAIFADPERLNRFGARTA